MCFAHVTVVLLELEHLLATLYVFELALHLVKLAHDIAEHACLVIGGGGVDVVHGRRCTVDTAHFETPCLSGGTHIGCGSTYHGIEWTSNILWRTQIGPAHNKHRDNCPDNKHAEQVQQPKLRHHFIRARRCCTADPWPVFCLQQTDCALNIEPPEAILKGCLDAW